MNDLSSFLFVSNEQLQIGHDAGRAQGAPKKIKEYRSTAGSLRGRPPSDLDGTLNGIWWILCTGAMWNQIPSVHGKHNSIWKCFRRWCESGMWAWILAKLANQYDEFHVALILDASHVKAHQDASRNSLDADSQALGKTKGGRNTKLSAVVNLTGRLVALKLVPGNQHDVKSAAEVLPKDLSGSFVLGDKGYDSDALRAEIAERGGVSNIPPKSNRKSFVKYSSEVGKVRHKVENFFCRIKSYRRVATRYDQLPQTYIGFVSLAAIIDWIRFEFVHVA